MARHRRFAAQLPAWLAISGILLAACAVLASSGKALPEQGAGTSERVYAPLVAADGVAPPPPTPTPISTPTLVPGPAVYFTFDDGPDSTWTPLVLEVLARHNARATFFVVGSYVDAYPAVVAEAATRGHSVGVHGYDHIALTRLSTSGIADQLTRANDAIERATGKRTTCMRPPYGAVNATVRDVAASLGFTVWMWSVDPWDWSGISAETIASRVVAAIQPGSVVILHDGGGNRSRTVAALDLILPELSRRGYQFLPLPC